VNVGGESLKQVNTCATGVGYGAFRWAKNYLFCWTQLRAEHVGIIQSLITTCRLHDINPYTHPVDVLQRVSIHPVSRVEQLTPRLWKEHFADNPMRSDIYDFYWMESRRAYLLMRQ